MDTTTLDRADRETTELLSQYFDVGDEADENPAGGDLSDPTTIAIAAMAAARANGASDAAMVAAGIRAVAMSGGGDGARIDSDRIAEQLLKWRVGTTRTTDRGQVYDYTKHLIRESPHCCRHAIDRGPYYRVHRAVVCSDECTERYAKAEPQTATAPYGVCDHCFLWLPATGVCGNCD